METFYKLFVKEKDDYVYSHNTLICEICTFDNITNRVIEQITLTNGKETKRNVRTEYFIDGMWKTFEFNDTIFRTLEEVKEYINREYLLVHSNKYNFFFLDIDTMDYVTTITNYKQAGLGCANTHINLQQLLELR